MDATRTCVAIARRASTAIASRASTSIARPCTTPFHLPSSSFTYPLTRSDPLHASFSSPIRAASSMASNPPSSIYDITVKDFRENDVRLDAYKSKVLLIVNVASQCGLTTSNYTELAEIYSKYKDQGLEILAFPCNQFGGQEPGSNEEIQEFACTRFKAEYPIFDKVEVNGSNASPLYKFLKNSKGGGIFGDAIKWNFTKFLVNRDGEVVQRYAPTTAPSKIEVSIKKCEKRNKRRVLDRPVIDSKRR